MSSPEVLTQLISALGPMGFVMWLVWRTTHHTIPRLAKSFEDASDRQREDFKEMFNLQRHDFERILQREQEIRQIQIDAIMTAIRDLTIAIREDVRRGSD